MQDQQTNSTLSTNGARKSLKGRTRQWKDLSTDPLSEGFDEHTAAYIVGRTPLTWSQLSIGSLFSRSKSGKNLHIKLDAAKAVSLDTNESLEIAPKYRPTLQVWKVTSFNSTTTGD
jgi:hypothetical protein